MWNDDGGTASHYHPPLSPERFKQIQLGYLHGYPVDAYLYPLCFSGYTTTFPSRSRAYTFIVDRLDRCSISADTRGCDSTGSSTTSADCGRPATTPRSC